MISIVMPKLGLTMTSGTIQQWLKKEGEAVSAGESLLEIETDKTSATVDAPAAGTLWGIKFATEGEEVDIGTTLAYLLVENEVPPVETADEATAPSVEAPPAEETPNMAAIQASVCSRDNIKVSPAARKFAKDLNISLKDVQPNENGIIHLAQVQAYQETHAQPKATPLARIKARELGVELAQIPTEGNRRIRSAQVEAFAAQSVPDAGDSGDTEVLFTGIRKTVARRMSQSMQEVPHFYHTVRVDMTKVKALMACQSTKVSVHDVLIRVLAQALSEYPGINVHVYQDRMILKKEINIGVAVATEKGLIVPVVRNVVSKNLKTIAEESAALVSRARKGSLQPDDYQGGTFTISNLGMFGIEEFTAIINQPEAAILAVGSTIETPVVENGEIAIRPMMTMTASFDHRAIDGVDGAKFLTRVKQLMEKPELLI